MLSPDEINAGTSPLTRTKVRALDAIIRNSEAYEANKAQYSGVYAALLALETAPASLAGVESSDDAAIKAKALDQLLVILPDEIGRGTLRIEGGDSGKNLSFVRDREDLIKYALMLLFDEVEVSGEALSNYVVVVPQGGGCGGGLHSCGLIQCPYCRGLNH